MLRVGPDRSSHVPTRTAAAALVALALGTAGPLPATEPPDGAGFSGTWALAASADDVAGRPARDGWAGAGLGGDRSRPAGGGFDLPLEVMTDARRLVVEDDGTALRVTYPSGRKRSFTADGEKRYIDDGDGPANVVARRKGNVLTVTSEWFRGYRLRESWEVTASPRRLVVTGKLKGRESQEYVRTYAPAPPEEAGPTPVPTAPAPAPAPPARPQGPPTPLPAATGASEGGAVGPAFHDRLGECTIRPPQRARPEELKALARVSQAEAGKAAVVSLGSARPTGVLSSDLEVFDGCLVWPVTLRFPEKGGVVEAFVDAGDGKVVKSEFIRTGPSSPEAP